MRSEATSENSLKNLKQCFYSLFILSNFCSQRGAQSYEPQIKQRVLLRPSRPGAPCRAEVVAAPASPPVSSLSVWATFPSHRGLPTGVTSDPDAPRPSSQRSGRPRARGSCARCPWSWSRFCRVRGVRLERRRQTTAPFRPPPAPCAPDDVARGCLVRRPLVEGQPGRFLASRERSGVCPVGAPPAAVGEGAPSRVPVVCAPGAHVPPWPSCSCFPVSVSWFAPFRGQVASWGWGCLPVPARGRLSHFGPSLPGSASPHGPQILGVCSGFLPLWGDPRPDWLSPALAHFFGQYKPPPPTASASRLPVSPPIFDPAGPLGSPSAASHLAPFSYPLSPEHLLLPHRTVPLGVATPVTWERNLQEGLQV